MDAAQMIRNAVKSSTDAAVGPDEHRLISVLHVDDEASLLRITKQLLETEGPFKVDTASSSEEAIQMLKKKTYDAIVSDYQMPGKNGLEFLRELRQEGNSIPFILLTGRGMELVAIQALNLGADHYVNKGVDTAMMFSELAHDISKAVERKRANLEAWLRQERLNAILDSSPNAIMIIDLSKNVIECNQETLRLTGFSSKEEVVGKDILEFVEERDRTRVSDTFQKVLKQGTAKDVQFGLLTRYGAGYIGEISASVTKDSVGNPTSLVVTINNITERKRAENKLRQYSKRMEENQRFLENVFAAFPDAVTVCDLEGIIIKCNQATLDLYGCSFENELTGLEIYTLLPQREYQRAKEEFRKVKMLGSVKNVEYAMLDRQGNEFPAELSVGAIMDSYGDSLGFAVITKDITERKCLQEQLVVSEKLAAVGRLAAAFSHDIRNPLAVIKNSICFLEMKLKGTTDDKVLKHMRILGEEINYANIMVNDLLDFTRKNPPRFQKANLNEVVDRALSSVSKPENIDVSLRLGEIPPIQIDEGQLQRVFANMIVNAIQAMSNGGKLAVQTARGHDLVEVVFSDNGTGIKEENLQKIFMPFFSTKPNGVGLGLSICKQIVENHGGRITVKSKAGSGTTFTIQLPIRQCDESMPSQVAVEKMEVSHT
jgi:PAS domain S-box-containing protein